MLKSAGVFLLTLLLSGAGLTLYLPAYTPEGSPVPVFQIMDATLEQAVESDTYLASSQAFEVPPEDPLPQGLQLGIFGTLRDAQLGAQQLAQKQLELALIPTIFKARHGERQWYVLALGPISNPLDTRNLDSLLQDNDVWVQTILWPPTDSEEAE